MLKNDPSFIYTTVKICDTCYESVKSLITQTETNQALLSLNQSKSNHNESTLKSSCKGKGFDLTDAFKQADDAYNAKENEEEVTDMMSVEVKVTKEGAKITPR